MRSNIEKDLRQIVRYVQEQTSFDVSSTRKTRRERPMAAKYLFYVLAREYTEATNEEIGEIAHRSRVGVSVAIRKHSNYAKEFYPQAYLRFNPFKTDIQPVDNPFKDTIKALYDAKEQLEVDISSIKEENKQMIDYMLRQVRNEKVFEILKLVKPLKKNELEIILDRLPPIIRMAQEFN